MNNSLMKETQKNIAYLERAKQFFQLSVVTYIKELYEQGDDISVEDVTTIHKYLPSGIHYTTTKTRNYNETCIVMSSAVYAGKTVFMIFNHEYGCCDFCDTDANLRETLEEVDNKPSKDLIDAVISNATSKITNSTLFKSFEEATVYMQKCISSDDVDNAEEKSVVSVNKTLREILIDHKLSDRITTQDAFEIGKLLKSNLPLRKDRTKVQRTLPGGQIIFVMQYYPDEVKLIIANAQKYIAERRK